MKKQIPHPRSGKEKIRTRYRDFCPGAESVKLSSWSIWNNQHRKNPLAKRV
jgi:hypothetical protein